MRIISKFKDYYDGCQDPTSGTIYLRDQATVEDLSLKRLLQLGGAGLPSLVGTYFNTDSPKSDVSYTIVAVIFCGVLHLGIRMHRPAVLYTTALTRYYWNYSEFQDDNRRTRDGRRLFLGFRPKEIEVLNVFKPSTSAVYSTQSMEMCHKYNTPILGLRTGIGPNPTPVTNASLKAVEFYKK